MALHRVAQHGRILTTPYTAPPDAHDSFSLPSAAFDQQQSSTGLHFYLVWESFVPCMCTEVERTLLAPLFDEGWQRKQPGTVFLNGGADRILLPVSLLPPPDGPGIVVNIVADRACPFLPSCATGPWPGIALTEGAALARGGVLGTRLLTWGPSPPSRRASRTVFTMVARDTLRPMGESGLHFALPHWKKEQWPPEDGAHQDYLQRTLLTCAIAFAEGTLQKAASLFVGPVTEKAVTDEHCHCLIGKYGAHVAGGSTLPCREYQQPRRGPGRRGCARCGFAAGWEHTPPKQCKFVPRCRDCGHAERCHRGV